MKKVAILFVLLCVFGTFIAGCDETTSYLSEDNVGSVSPQDFGEGIYYFPAFNATFGRSLAEFRRKNPTLRIITITSSSLDGYGNTSGYWVIVAQAD